MNFEPCVSTFFGNRSVVEIVKPPRDCYKSLFLRLAKLRNQRSICALALLVAYPDIEDQADFISPVTQAISITSTTFLCCHCSDSFSPSESAVS
jgi:hypothetical protein